MLACSIIVLVRFTSSCVAKGSGVVHAFGNYNALMDGLHGTPVITMHWSQCRSQSMCRRRRGQHTYAISGAHGDKPAQLYPPTAAAATATVAAAGKAHSE